MESSQGSDFVGIFATHGQFPVGHHFVAVQFYSCLNQPQLFTRQLARKNFAITDTN
jgi:hypothetical protein